VSSAKPIPAHARLADPIDASAGEGRENAVAPRASVGIARWEWGAVCTVLLVCGAFVWDQTRHYWFRTDDWLFLDERATSIRDLMHPHGGHLTAVALVAYKAMFTLFGMRQYPPYVGFRVVGFGLMVLSLWWILRRRGADPVISLAVVAYLGVLSSTVGNKVVSIGIYVAVPAILLAFLIVDEHPEPTPRERLVVALLLFVALVSNTFGDIGIVALTITVACSAPHRRSWLAICAGYTGAFAAWSIAYRSQIAAPEPHQRGLVRKTLDIPIDVLRLGRSTIEQLTFPGSRFGAILLVALIALIGWAALRGWLGLFEYAAIATVVLTFAGNSLNRLHTALGAVDTLRYADPLALFLIPALLPFAKPRTRLGCGLIVLVVLGLALSQANEFSHQADNLVQFANLTRPQLTAARQLIIEGEPYVHQSRFVDATNDDIAHLAHAPGWGAAPSEALKFARGRLRIGIAGRGRPVATHEQEAVPLAPNGRPLRECLAARTGNPVVLTLVAGRGSSILLRTGSPGAKALLRTQDRFGSGLLTVAIGAPTKVVVVTPDSGSAQLSVTPTSGAVEVCTPQRP